MNKDDDDAAKAIDRQLEQLLILTLLNSLRRREEDDGASRDDLTATAAKVTSLDDQSAISRELMILAQRLIDAQLLDLWRDEDKTHVPSLPALKILQSSLSSSVSPDQQLMDGDEAAAIKKKKKKSAATAKKKRYRKNKAAAKRRKKSGRVSWLRSAAILPQIIMMALGSITTLIVCLTIMNQSVDGSSEGGGAAPALPPTTSKSLLRSPHRSSNVDILASLTLLKPDIINTPSIAVVSTHPVLSPTQTEDSARVTSRGMQQLVEVTTLSTDRNSSSLYDVLPGCFHTPNWTDFNENGCNWYESEDRCENYGTEWAKELGPATEHCCGCGGGIRTCEEYRPACQKYFNLSFCEAAESCHCEGEDHEVKLFTYLPQGDAVTEGKLNQCKCDFWSHLCQDVGGVACNHAAEYCCGDYGMLDTTIYFVSSPSCYCDFYNYAKQEFNHELKVMELTNKSEEVLDPCSLVDVFWRVKYDSLGSSVLQNYVNIASFFFTLDDKGSLTTIFERTNGQNWINNVGWMNDEIPHCEWYGITCNDDGIITGIDLRGNNLTGQFPVYTRTHVALGNVVPESFWLYTKTGLAELFYLKTLNLADNKLTGTIEYPPLYNLRELTHFDVSGNQLSGSFDPLITPSIIYANFSNNRFTSMDRFQPFKVSPLKTLRSCDVSNNNITAKNATDLFKYVPSNIEQFIAFNNNIQGELPKSSLNKLPKLRRFKISSNALSGQIPVFEESFLSLRELDLSNQSYGFPGSIPNDLWRIQFLKILSLAGNKLTGTLPPDVGNLVTLESFDVSNNRLSGQIPSQIGQLDDADVHLKDNSFDINATTPLSLCTPIKIKASDLVDNKKLCPIERTALSNIYFLAKGVEWTDATYWMDEYTSHCDWYGVECDDNNHVTELDLRNNGLSGRLSPSIGYLTSLTKLDLSDNDIKGSIPIEIGLLTQLKYLRLSYNAFTGNAPDELLNLNNLQLLQLQSNRITGMPNLPRFKFDKTIFSDGNSMFVADCGVPSAFEDVLVCEKCTMCCNANEDCYPQVPTKKFNLETVTEKWGLNYSSFAAIVFVFFSLLCCMLIFFLSRFHKQQRSASTLTLSMQEKKEQDDDYALSKIGKDSVYSYFVTDLRLGWLCAFATLVAQALILIFFVQASEAKLQDDKTDIKFTWKCPRDTDLCSDRSDLENVGWFIFCVLMAAFLAKDLINGFKLLYHSSKARHMFWARTRYFIGGLSLCIITLYALYVSIVYNSAIATSNTDIILNSVVVLFIMDMDQVIFAAIEAINDKWTAHVGKSEDARSDSEEADGGTSTEALEELRRDIAAQDEKIAAQQVEIRMLRKTMEQIQILQSYPATTTTPVTSPESISQYGSSDESVVSPPANEGRQDNAASVTCNLFGDNNLHDDEEVRAIQTQHDHGLSNSKPNFAEQEAVTEEFEQLE